MLAVFILLFFLFCARFGWDVLLFAVPVSGLLFYACTKALGYSLEKEKRLWRLLPRILSYLAFLAGEMVRACLKVIGLILSAKYETEPCLVTFETSLRSPVLRAVLANSITLTPGTISVSVTGDLFCVHCLDTAFAAGLKGGAFEKRLARMEQEGREEA